MTLNAPLKISYRKNCPAMIAPDLGLGLELGSGFRLGLGLRLGSGFRFSLGLGLGLGLGLRLDDRARP